MTWEVMFKARLDDVRRYTASCARGELCCLLERKYQIAADEVRQASLTVVAKLCYIVTSCNEGYVDDVSADADEDFDVA